MKSVCLRPAHLQVAACLLALVVSTTLAQSNTTLVPTENVTYVVGMTVDPCPNAKWQDAVFLKDPTDPLYFMNVDEWEFEDAKKYLQDDLLKDLYASFAFLAMGLLSLFIFITWRVIRACCVCCCCKASCEDKRQQADPRVVLKGWGMWVIKGTMLVLAIVAMCLTIWGMSKVKKDLVKEAWVVVDNTLAFSDEIVAVANDLIDNATAITPVIDDFSALVNRAVNPTMTRASLGLIGTFLDAPSTNPTTLKAALVAAQDSITALTTQTADWRNYLNTLQASGLAPAAASIAAASATYFSTMSNRLGQLKTALDNAGTGTPTVSSPAITNLETALDAADNTAWTASLNTLIASLDAWEAQKGSFTTWQQASRSLASLSTTVTAAGGPSGTIGKAGSQMSSFASGRAVSAPAFTDILSRLVTINTTFMILDAPTTAAYDTLKTTNDALVTVFAITPTIAEVGSDLNQLSAATSLPSDNLSPSLDTTAAKLNSSAATAQFKTFAANLNASLTTLSPLLADVRTKYNAYISAGGGVPTELQTACNTASTPTGNSQAAATIPAGSSTTISSVQSAATDVNNLAIGPKLTASNTATENIRTSLTANVPTPGGLTPYATLCDQLIPPYNGITDTPKSKMLEPANEALVTVDDALQSAENVKADVDSNIADIRKIPDDIDDNIKGKVDDVRVDWEKKSIDYGDGIRYKVLLAIYGVGLLILVLLIIVSAINCPCGIGFVLFLLYVWLCLYFLLAIIIAAVLSVQNDACPAVETIVIENLSNDTQMVARYFFFGEGGSVRDVLNNADVVDMSKVDKQIADAKNEVSNAITGSYTPVGELNDLLGQVNATADNMQAALDALLAKASYEEVNPVYREIKAYICCTVADEIAVIWNAYTFAGWLMMVLAWFGNALLGRLDKLPRSGCCCACTCISAADADRVHPDNGGDPEAGKLGDNGGKDPNGAYDPNVPPQQQQLPYYPPGAAPTVVVMPPGPMTPMMVPMAAPVAYDTTPQYYPAVPAVDNAQQGGGSQRSQRSNNGFDQQQQPAAYDQQPAAYDQQPAAYDQQPAAYDQRPPSQEAGRYPAVPPQ